MRSSIVRRLPLARLGFGLLLTGLSLFASTARAEVEVVTSIKPLALIARAVVGEGGQVSHLLPPNASPHDYPLKVSDMQRLTGADLVVWVGEDLETFLRRPLARLKPEQRLTLAELGGIHWPEESHSEHGHDEHHHGPRDPHLWLNPQNGSAAALALAERLASLDPAGADGYRSRARALTQSLTELDKALENRLAPVREVPFAVYHAGYQHFVEHYQLNQRAAVTLSPERRPGARHLYELRETLQDTACLFTEPYYDMSSARRLADELGLRLAELDLLGAREEVASYPQLLERLGEDVARCLESEGR
ncbi:zinc ABC transporter substrate-binding protein [Marinimicrobium agarilyticum]|uniref:zinc ABC transporter substrate-binding protein n=1 Tax=Marinimicrobium agarilyticum TaxID=306546 RepID=UPI0004257556|nr:zinc ABC transporter substrate-binding protein [Marinimicrobium agarilyticum]